MVDMAARMEAAKLERRKEVGRRIAYQRNLKDWSQETLGAEVGRVMGRDAMTIRQISRIENGENSVPFDLLDALAGLFGVSPQELVPENPPRVRQARGAVPTRRREPPPPPAVRKRANG